MTTSLFMGHRSLPGAAYGFIRTIDPAQRERMSAPTLTQLSSENHALTSKLFQSIGRSRQSYQTGW